MAELNKVAIELSVVLGRSSMPVHQLLRMGRGAVIELDTTEQDDVLILANNVPIAKGTIIVQGDRVAISVTRLLQRTANDR